MDAVQNARDLLAIAESLGSRGTGKTTALVNLCLERDATFVTYHGMQARIFEREHPELRAKSIHQLRNFDLRERGRAEATKIVVDHYTYEAVLRSLLYAYEKLEREWTASEALINDLKRLGQSDQDGLSGA